MIENLYNLIYSDLTTSEIAEINKLVDKEQRNLSLFVKNLNSKINLKKKNFLIKPKRIFLNGLFAFQLSQPLILGSKAGIISLPPIGIHKLMNLQEDKIIGNKNYYAKIVDIIEQKGDKIILTNQQIQRLDSILNQFKSGSISIDVVNQFKSGSISLEEAVLQLRGGDGLTDTIFILAFVIFVNWYDAFINNGKADAFPVTPLPHQDVNGWLTGKYNSKNSGSYSANSKPTSLKMEKPTQMPQVEYSSMTKSKKRQLADPKGRDVVIEIENRPKLTIRYNQLKYKISKHGKDHNLPVNDTNKTPKTEDNILSFRQSLIDMANNNAVTWYTTNAQYQGGTPRGCESVNIFDEETRVIAVYQKQADESYLFLTTCTLTELEVDHLRSTRGNFLTEEMIKQKTALSTNVESTNIENLTNTENDL